MEISRRNFGSTTLGSAALLAGISLGTETACATTTADDITLVIGAAEGVLDIILPFIPGGSALVGVAKSIANSLSQVVTIWGGAGTNEQKWAQMLTVLEAIPGEILTLSPQLQAIIAGVGAAVQTIINVIVQLQSGAPAGAVASARAVNLAAGPPNAKGVAGLLSAIKATQAKLAKL